MDFTRYAIVCLMNLMLSSSFNFFNFLLLLVVHQWYKCFINWTTFSCNVMCQYNKYRSIYWYLLIKLCIMTHSLIFVNNYRWRIVSLKNRSWLNVRKCFFLISDQRFECKYLCIKKVFRPGYAWSGTVSNTFLSKSLILSSIFSSFSFI